MLVMVMATAEVMAMIVVMVAIQEQLHSLKMMITENKQLLDGRGETERAWVSVHNFTPFESVSTNCLSLKLTRCWCNPLPCVLPSATPTASLTTSTSMSSSTSTTSLTITTSLTTASSSLLTIGAVSTDVARLIAIVTYNSCKRSGAADLVLL